MAFGFVQETIAYAWARILNIELFALNIAHTQLHAACKVNLQTFPTPMLY